MKRLLISLVAVALVLSACAPKTTTTPAVTVTHTVTVTPSPSPAPTSTPAGHKPYGTLVVANPTLGTMAVSPRNAPTMYSHQLLDPVYEYLIYRDPETWQAMPGLATRWERSEDAKTWTFYLRRGVSFQEGWGEFTAEDVKYTLELVMSPGAINSGSPQFRNSIDRIEIVDPYQVVFHLKKPWALLDYELSNSQSTPMNSKKYFETVGLEKAEAHPIGTGPFKFVERVLGDYVKFEAVEQHWRQVPYFKTLIMKEVPEASTRVAMLESGAADITPLSMAQIDEVEKAGLQVREYKPVFIIYILLAGQWRPDRPGYDPNRPWMNKKVREALNLAIDRDEIIQRIFRGKAVPAALTHMQQGGLGWNPDWKPYPYDPEQARKLLAEAGYPKGFDMELWLTKTTSVPELSDVGQAVAMYWEKIGVHVKIAMKDFARDIKPLYVERSPKLQSFTMWGTVLFPDPSPFLGYFYGSDSSNGFKEGPPVDDMIKAVLTETDREKRGEAMGKLMDWLYKDYTFVPVAFPDIMYGLSKEVGRWPQLQYYGYPTNWEYIEHGQ